MKLRNKKSGEIWDIGKVLTNDYPCWETLDQICEDWEDVIPKEYSKYYLINEETGYIATFDSEREMLIFNKEIKGWKPVKVLLDGEKYTIERI